jgi:hypothetical protein
MMMRFRFWAIAMGLFLACGLLAGCVDHACLAACSARHQACVTAARNAEELRTCDQFLSACSAPCHSR